MSKTAWGALVSVFFALVGIFLPAIPNLWRLGIFGFGVLGLFISCIGWYSAHRKEKTTSESDAPKFDTFEPRIEYRDVINKFEISIGYCNIGKRDALDVDTAIWVSDCSLTRNSVVRRHESGTDVPPNSPRFFNNTFSISKPNIHPLFIVLTISYRGKTSPNTSREADIFL